MYAVWKSQYEYIYYLFVFLLYNIEKKKRRRLELLHLKFLENK